MLDANPASTAIPEKPAAMDPPEGFIEIAKASGSIAFVTDRARQWLEGRGVSTRTCRAARIGVCFSGYFKNRIIIPVLDPFDPDRWLGYVGRALDDREPRYLYPQGMQRGKLLYNGAELHRVSDDPVILVEGCLDSLPHFPHTVAGLGKPTETQLEMLLTCKRPIVVCLDGDAWAEGLAHARTLALERPNVAALRLPPRIDPGNLVAGSLLPLALSALRSEDQPYVV
jgi:DNA primase